MTETQITLDDLAAMVGRGFKEQREYMDGRFEQIDKRFEEVDRRFEQIDKRFEEVDRRFEQIDKRFEGVDRRLKKIDSQILNINARLDLIETDLSNLNNLYQEVREIHQLLDEVVFRREFEVWKKRLLRVEQHLGLAK